jgi:hypothetical protein
MTSPPSRYLYQFNRETADYLAQCRIERFIEKELSDDMETY